jgi:predicted transposase YbfD/YdcC
LEIRQIWTSTEINDYIGFPHCGQVVCIQRYREELKSGKIHTETIYGITSLSKNEADGDRILALARGHWGIENKSHYVRDVTFDEDRSKVRTKSGPRIMATLRNLAISMLRLIGYSNIAKATREMMFKPHLVLNLIGV